MTVSRKAWLALFVLAVLLAPRVHAWSWENYVGTTHWSVDVAEDDTSCNGGGEPTHETVAVTITHGYDSQAGVSDWAHGDAHGRFTGNTLSIPGRTIADPPGQSVLAPFDMTFTTDCLSFWGKYTWHYTDSEISCDGSTQLTGTRTDGNSCPGLPPSPTSPTQTPEQQSQTINDAHLGVANERDLRKQIDELDRLILNDDPDSPSYELNTYDRQKLRAKFEAQYEQSKATYEQILARDPTNYWANLDMSELERLQGNSHGFFNYFEHAATNKNVFEHTADVVEDQAATSMGLKEFPTPDKSKLVNKISSNLKSDEPIGQETPSKSLKDYWKAFKTAVHDYLHPQTYDSIYELGGTPVIKN